jgi:branched-chain amino acid transport system substrate-binding protein
MDQSSRLLRCLAVVGIACAAVPASAGKKYDPGASDSEIKIGNIAVYSGPASVYGVLGRTLAAYFNMVNAEGGVNGRKIKFISYDDAFSPPKAVEQARRLVEGDEVLFIAMPSGSASNLAIRQYMNERKVPQLFASAPSSKLGDPKNFPWTMGFGLDCRRQGRIYARYVLQNHPGARIGMLYQNDDFGKDCVQGVKDVLGEKAKATVVSEQPYELADATVDSQIVSLKASRANVFVNFSTPKAATQAIRKAHQIGWSPVHLLGNVSASIGAVFRPAGLEASKGILTVGYFKDPINPEWKADPAVKGWHAFMDRYFPDGDKTSTFIGYAYIVASALVQVLRQCGDELTRENVMRQAANLKDVDLPLLEPGIKVNTSPSDYFPIEQARVARFDGERWVHLGPVMDAMGGSR